MPLRCRKHWDDPKSPPSRYSLAKFQALLTYQRQTSTRRAWAVLVLTPVPALAFVLLLAFIPIQDPHAGALANWGFYLLFYLGSVGACTGCCLSLYGDAGLTPAEYAWTDFFLSVTLAPMFYTALAFVIGRFWRFPVPFVLNLLVGPFVAFLIAVNVVILRRRGSEAIGRIRRATSPVLPAFLFESSQIVIYPAIGALFQSIGEWPRIVVITLLPALRLAIRWRTRRLAAHLRHAADDVAVAGTEMCAVLFQSTVLQLKPSRMTTAAVIAVEMIQAVEAVVVFYRLGTMPHAIVGSMPKRAMSGMLCHVVPDPHAAATTMPKSLHLNISELVSNAVSAVSDDGNGLDDNSQSPQRPTIIRVRPCESQTNEPVSTDKQRVILHALRMMRAAETVLLTEYIEVMIPMLNVTYLFVASHVDSAAYNTKLAPFYHDPSRLPSVLRSLTVYAIMQGLSMIVVVILMRRRFRSSALVHLAFVLEHHRWSIQGRLVVWLLTFLHISIVHYGVDFTFRFEFATPSAAAGDGPG